MRLLIEVISRLGDFPAHCLLLLLLMIYNYLLLQQMEAGIFIPSLGKGNRIKKPSLKALESLNVDAQLKSTGSAEDEIVNYFASEDSTSEENEYSTSEESSSDDSERNSDSLIEVDCESPQAKSSIQNVSKLTRNVAGRQRKTKISSYVIKSEDYFLSNTSKKNKTSNHTLERLAKPRISQGELQKLVSDLSLSEHHGKAISEMRNQNNLDFNKWFSLLQEGFNVLLYGLGSKREILNQFREEHLKNAPVVVINGFFPSLTIKDILDVIIVDILELKENPPNLFEAVDLIIGELASFEDVHLYLMVHNIEGEALRTNPRNQAVLATLAAAKNIHLIASVDHINAFLIWDHKKMSKFNFTWWDVTSFAPYINEVSFETSMMVNRSGSLALSSLRNVFLSLTSNSKGIYRLVAKYQIEHGSAQYYQGMAFKDLYGACREAFLVSSDLALRAQLTEFVDHKMVKFRRSADGAEHLVIPISNSLLQQFINDQ